MATQTNPEAETTEAKALEAYIAKIRRMAAEDEPIDLDAVFEKLEADCRK